jgi:hypothetical protein
VAVHVPQHSLGGGGNNKNINANYRTSSFGSRGNVKVPAGSDQQTNHEGKKRPMNPVQNRWLERVHIINNNNNNNNNMKIPHWTTIRMIRFTTHISTMTIITWKGCGVLDYDLGKERYEDAALLPVGEDPRCEALFDFFRTPRP